MFLKLRNYSPVPGLSLVRKSDFKNKVIKANMANFTPTSQLISNDPQLKDFNYGNFPKAVASNEVVEKTKKALESKKHQVSVVKNKHEALELIKKLVPKGASVNNAGSTTLWEIGFVDHLKAQTEWVNLHGQSLAETDPIKKAELEMKKQHADYFFTSVPAITENGELTVCCASGSRTGPFIFSSKSVVIVAGTNKIVPNLEKAVERQKTVALPLESARARIAYGAYGITGSAINYQGIVNSPSPFGPSGKYHIIFVDEVLGF